LAWFVSSFFLLTLTLLMARVCTDHAHHAFAADDATVHANASNGTTYFHCFYSTFVVERRVIIPKNRPLDKGVNENFFILTVYAGLPPAQ
jgi:hypothetical protein